MQNRKQAKPKKCKTDNGRTRRTPKERTTTSFSKRTLYTTARCSTLLNENRITVFLSICRSAGLRQARRSADGKPENILLGRYNLQKRPLVRCTCSNRFRIVSKKRVLIPDTGSALKATNILIPPDLQRIAPGWRPLAPAIAILWNFFSLTPQKLFSVPTTFSWPGRRIFSSQTWLPPERH